MNRLQAGALSLSAAGLVAIAGYEGYSGVAYQPLPGDKPTIGFGATEGVHIGDRTTQPQNSRFITEAGSLSGKRCIPP